MLLAVAAAAAGAVEISDARLERRAAADPAAVVATLAGEGRVWLAWSVPGTAAATEACCFRRGWNERGCTLAGRDQGWGTSSDWPRLPAGDLVILAEIDHGRLVRLRAVGSACPIDGAGRRVVALAGVDPAKSVDLLLRWAQDPRSPEEVLDPALLGILGHDLPDVALRVVKLAEDATLPVRVRKQALFWLADSGDPRALDEIEKILAR
jgi:hypothetical protein